MYKNVILRNILHRTTSRSSTWDKEWEGMGIKHLSAGGNGNNFENTTGMGWEWECYHGNGREWDEKGRSRTPLVHINIYFGKMFALRFLSCEV